jgi:hypothetical protein
MLYAGCAEKDVEPIVLEPETKLSDIAGGTLTTKKNQYHLVNRNRSEGRFPGAVAVARLKLADGAPIEAPRPVELKPLKDEEAAYWNHLFDNLRWVRQYFELSPMSVQTPVVSAKALLGAAKRLDASLCLLYGQSDFEDLRSHVVGVLYETGTGQLLATIQAESVGAEDWLEERPPDRPEMDNRHQDNHYLAARKFQRLVHACVRELVSLDKPTREEKPSGWKEPAAPPANSPLNLP